ncbi:MAG TPA: glycoside hydrolase family 76 protein [Streptosporangiaceae bacterium]|nr:glycoside hydrolase family 76 protein [Streptosporangiaceae bacterium]
MAVDDDVQQPDYRAYAAAGMEALQRWYRRWTGLWRTTGWWNAANVLTAVIAYTQRTGDQSYLGVVERTFRGARRRHSDFVVSFYDDNGWWGLAWVAAYDLTGEARYLDAARTIFANLLTGWDDACGGGVWWNTDRGYKNAITNELFLTLAARLHQRSPGTGEYLEWARREWDWFCARGLAGPSGLINDGLDDACQNNGGQTWTYNQGVVLGGLAALHEITGDAGYLRQGEAIADAALGSLISPVPGARHGVLLEPGEDSTARSDGDRPQFKGIFVRNLYDFYLQSPRPAYAEFILDNARSIWDNNRNASNQFGLHWAGPFDYPDASRQSSALDVLNAAVPLAAG